MILLAILAVALLILGSIFSALEVSIISVKEYRLSKLAESKYWAKIGLLLKKNLQKVVIFSLFGNSFVNALLSTAATIVITKITNGNSLYISITTVSITIAIIIFSEALPKILANRYPESVIRLFAIPSYYLLQILSPIIWVIDMMITILSQLFGKIKTTQALPLDELTDIINHQSLKQNYHKVLINSINTTKLTINEVVIPHRLISAIDINDSYINNLNKIKNSYHTKTIVYKDNIENILGYIHTKDILFNIDQEYPINLISQIRSIPLSFEFLYIAEQINKAILTKDRIFLVIDQYGNSKGIAFLEDMLELIYGEFSSSSPTFNFISELDDNLIIDGAASISKLNNLYKLDIPTSSKYHTINGFLLYLLREIPSNKTSVRYKHLVFEVISIGKFWVERVKISKL